MLVGRCCHCGSTPPGTTDCFGCTVPVEVVPTEWILDLPTSLSYGAGISTSGTSVQTVGPNGNQKTEISMEYELPSLTGFGTATSLELDTKTVIDTNAPWTKCIWSSNFSIYETESHEPGSAVPYTQGFGVPGSCWPNGLVLAPPNKTVLTSQPSPWEYGNSNMLVDPPHSFSLNRSRSTKASTPLSECNKTYCANPLNKTLCWWKKFGIFGVLQIFGGNKLRLNIVFWPRIMKYLISYQLTGSPAGWRPSASEQGTWGPWTLPNASTYPGHTAGFSYNWKTMFPRFATAGVDPVSTIGAVGIILIYEKTINCATDFTGNPVTLNLTVEAEYGPTGQKNWYLMGLNTPPSTVTVTPV